MVSLSVFSKRKFNVVLFLLAVMLILVVTGLFTYKFLSGEKLVAKEFAGSVEKVEGNLIYVQGVSIVHERLELSKTEFTRLVSVKVTPRTQFTRVVTYMPTSEELKKTNGRWNPAELKRERTAGTLAEIAKGGTAAIKIITKENIFNKSTFTVESIEYVIVVYPSSI